MNSLPTIKRTFALAALIAVSFAFSACATGPNPRTLVNNDMVGTHTVQYELQKRAPGTGAQFLKAMSEDDGDDDILYDLWVRVCDISQEDEQVNCKSSTVLQALDMNPGSGTYDLLAGRTITTMFWHRENVFYIGYTDPNPKVRRCYVKKNNAMTCKDQGNLNSMLTKTVGGKMK
jgi:hypothetical protein